MLLAQLPGSLPLVTSVTRYCMTLYMLCTWSVVTSVTWWLPVVTMCYQHYQVLHDSMLYTWSVVTSVTWWLPVITMCYHQVLHDSMLCTWSVVTSVTWWLPVVTMCYHQVLHDSMLCMLCIITSVTLWVTVVTLATGITWYCRTLGCIHGVLVNTVTTVTCV